MSRIVGLILILTLAAHAFAWATVPAIIVTFLYWFYSIMGGFVLVCLLLGFLGLLFGADMSKSKKKVSVFQYLWSVVMLSFTAYVLAVLGWAFACVSTLATLCMVAILFERK